MTQYDTHPTVLLVTGPPGTGKTTLVSALLPLLAASGITLPVFTKDGFKETLFDALGNGDRAWSNRLGKASTLLLWHVLEQELAAGRSCLLESNFHANLATPELAALRERQPFSLIQLLCRTEPDVLVARLRHRTEIRARHPGHLDAEWTPALSQETIPWRAEPLALEGDTLDVDTTNWDQVDITGIAARIAAFWQSKES